MQKKPKKPIKKIGKFIREVSVVVIGIAIAVSINGWISNRSERNNVDTFLQAVRLELEANLQMLENSNQLIVVPKVRYANYLRSLRGQPANADSIRYHLWDVISVQDGFIASTHAFEMFKFSGYMRFLDPNLQLAIWGTYAIIDDITRLTRRLAEERWDEIRSHNSWRTASDEELVENPPLYSLYVHSLVHTIWENVYRNMRGSIEWTLARLEER